jgi:hypothetical protein
VLRPLCSVHDQKNLEDQGVPGVFIASSEFIDAADHQARALGMQADVVYVQHPIQDRTDAEMQQLADSVVDEIVAKLLGR